MEPVARCSSEDLACLAGQKTADEHAGNVVAASRVDDAEHPQQTEEVHEPHSMDGERERRSPRCLLDGERHHDKSRSDEPNRTIEQRERLSVARHFG